jgi:hypothetical protein
MTYLITVTFQRPHLFFKVESYEIKNERCIFTDKKTGLRKDFPGKFCLIEEIL